MKENENLSTKPKRANGNGSIPDFGVWRGAYSQVFEGWAQSGAGMMKSAAEISQEIMNFSQSRLQADMNAWQELASCHSPVELFECETRFAQKAASEYFDEAQRLISQMIVAMSSGVVPREHGQAVREQPTGPL